jgi:tetratricopeptide (TPR) repeat protein
MLRFLLHLPLLVLVASACGEVGLVRGTDGRRPRAVVAAGRQVTDANIAFFEDRVARDPYGARDRARLAALYLARARATGSEADLGRAEAMAHESQRVRARRNPDAAQVMAGALMAQHRFRDAHEIVLGVVRTDPGDALARATLGEIALELGRYAEADSLFATMAIRRYDPAIGPRYARWLEINGRAGEARALLEKVRTRLEGGFRVPPEQVAWFDLRLGELAARNGRPDLAAHALRRGLMLVPGDASLLTALARLRGYSGEWADAVELAEQALAARFDPSTLALLAEAHAALGDSAAAAEAARAMAVSVSGLTGGFHRGWALFLLDHGADPAQVLHRAEAERGERQDVYGDDLLAWALHRAGRTAEARPLADAALRLGTQDPVLYYHAGMIALAAGDTLTGVARLSTALQAGGLLHPSQAAAARALLRGADR